MKRFFTLIASTLLVLSVTSCDKEGGSDFPPYYKVSTSYRMTSGTSGNSDFSKIFAVSDQYVNTEFSSETQATAAYNDILSKTKDVSYSAPGESFVKLSIVKYISKKENENTYQYYADPNYKSPVGHIWDARGSRDL